MKVLLLAAGLSFLLLLSVIALAFSIAQFWLPPTVMMGSVVAICWAHFAACALGAAATVWGVAE